jgi:hypothetical protein
LLALLRKDSGIPPKGEIRFGVCAEHPGTSGDRRDDEMSAAELDVYIESESERIQRWRAEELERAGYGPGEAAELAGRSDVDLHLAVELLERGCPTTTALRILL